MWLFDSLQIVLGKKEEDQKRDKFCFVKYPLKQYK